MDQPGLCSLPTPFKMSHRVKVDEELGENTSDWLHRGWSSLRKTMTGILDGQPRAEGHPPNPRLLSVLQKIRCGDSGGLVVTLGCILGVFVGGI